MSEARQLVWEIRDLYRELPDTIAAIAGLHAISYDRGTTRSNRQPTHTTVLGGDALVMYGPGTDRTSIDRTAREPIDWALAQAETDDAPSVLTVLTRWEDAFRDAQGHPAADTTSINAAVTYLTTHTAWAVQHFPDLDAYLEELSTLRARLRAVTGRINPAKPSDAPCFRCNGQIVQRYKDGPRPEDRGLDDIRECNRCGQTYTPAQYMLAVQQRLEAVRNDPDRLLTAAEARTLWRLSEKQVYVWENRDKKLQSVGRDDAGRKLYRNADLARLKGHTQTTNDTPVTPVVYSTPDGRGMPGQENR